MKKIRIATFGLFFVFSLILSACSKPATHGEALSKVNPTPGGQSTDVLPKTGTGVEPVSAETQIKAESMALQPAGVDGKTAISAVPEISLEQLKETIANRRNKPLLLCFWATWSQASVLEITEIVKLYTQYEKEMDFLLISADADSNTQNKVPEIMKKQNVLFDSKIMVKSDLARTFDALDPGWNGELPAIFIYDANSKKQVLFKDMQALETLQAALPVKKK